MVGRLGLVFLLFFASGASGLIYEIVWVREFGTLFGSTVYSAALVTGIFMLGLGVGGFLAGRFADRAFDVDPVRPLRWYAGFELGIALLATVAMLLIPQLAELSAWASSYVEGADGWYRLSAWSSLFRYGCAVLLLGPVTLLMGGTLTLLIRFLVADEVASAGFRIGILYGVNTAGAALGCLLTDTLFVPLIGLRATQSIAIGLNLVAALGAFLLARSLRGWTARAAPASPAASPAAEPDAGNATAWVALAIALTGFASMAMQIVWFRHLISLFGGTREVFSLLLTVILVGIWLGSLAGGALERLTRRPVQLFLVAQVGFVLWALNALLLLDRGEVLVAMRDQFEATRDAATWVRSVGRYQVLLGATAWVVGPPAFFSGAAFPLANAIVQRSRAAVGRRAGLLYLANTCGGVSGSLLAGLWLLPRIGVQGTAGLAAACVVASMFALERGGRRLATGAPGRLLPVLCFGLGLLVLAGWSRLPDDRLVRTTLPPHLRAEENVFALTEGVNETIAILGVPGVTMNLWTNGHNMSGTNFAAQRYMRAFVHVPALISERLENVMVMCFGVGNTTRSALLHPGIRRVDVVDLSADVLGHSRHFAPINGHPLEDPRVSVYVNDARQHLRMLPGETYDLITGEPPPIAFAGVVNLYTREFFELVRSRLRTGGMASYWLPLNQVNEAVARSMVRAFLDVFPEALLLDGYRHHLMLLGRKDAPLEMDPARFRARLSADPALRFELFGMALETPVDLAGMYAASPATLRRATEGVRPLRDDHPTLEYANPAMHADAGLPDDLVALDDLEVWCPSCRSGGLTPEETSRLAGYLEVTGIYYGSDSFLRFGPSKPLPSDLALSPEAERAVGSHFYLLDVLGRVPLEHLAAFSALWHGRIDVATEHLVRFLESQPEHRLARVQLAELLVKRGRPAEARAQLERVLGEDAAHPAARRAWDAAGFGALP